MAKDRRIKAEACRIHASPEVISCTFLVVPMSLIENKMNPLLWDHSLCWLDVQGLHFQGSQHLYSLGVKNTQVLTIHDSEYFKVCRSCANSLCLRTDDKQHSSAQEHFQNAVLDTEILSFTKCVYFTYLVCQTCSVQFRIFWCFLRHKFTWSEYKDILELSFFQI